MSPINFFVASLNFTQADNAFKALHQFAAERSLFMSLIEWSWSNKTTDWLSQPLVYSVILAWWITFTAATLLLGLLGFGPKGIIAGTLVASFQSWVYGGFTPAGGIFATLTSLAMLGYFMRLQAGVAFVIATGVAVTVYSFQS
ncbi:uncharacterized protein K489DRAFT_411695 [Dissoconium aciculare CBS 342.82]|uniref:Uncharacterized protein n=1 Tax=Dissoconium aciculare CBS 342.82 TaxID=1314786 RepID=A0A6J3M1E6_9PEZI|nr:uncharacterized protein K489DRAFT_411695 [Dissoconium aciculare CBS 342.82]KAF1821324.1 hypothetical protein K489DRAFT_411695 [Dissoconium aciculare CBS 342.82]